MTLSNCIRQLDIQCSDNLNAFKYCPAKWIRQGGMLAIYGPIIYTAPYIMFLMRADPLQGQVGGGWALEIYTFWVL